MVPRVCRSGGKFAEAENTGKVSQSEDHELGLGHVGVLVGSLDRKFSRLETEGCESSPMDCHQSRSHG